VEFLATLSQTLQAFSTGALAHDRADVFVYAADAHGSLDASRLPTGLAGRASRVPGVAAATDLGVFDFTVTAGGSSFALALFGTGTSTSTSTSTATSIRGRVPGPAQGLADSSEATAGLGIGQRITLRPGDATIRIAALASGIRYDGVMTVWTTFATWQRAVAAADPGGPAGIANALAVRARPGVSAAVLARRLNAALPGTEAFTRSAAVADVPGAAIIAATFDLLIATAFAVAVLVVGSVFLLVTIQRLRGCAAGRCSGRWAPRPHTSAWRSSPRSCSWCWPRQARARFRATQVGFVFAGRQRACGPTGYSKRSASLDGPGSCRDSCRVANSSGWPSPGRSSTIPRSCWRTSRPRASIPSEARRSSSFWPVRSTSVARPAFWSRMTPGWLAVPTGSSA
jgi:hypothetical protein